MRKNKVLWTIMASIIIAVGGLAWQTWAAVSYTVSASRCTDVRVTYAVDGSVETLRAEIVPMDKGVRVGRVNTHGVTVAAADLSEQIKTTLATLRQQVEALESGKTGWSAEVVGP